MQIRYILISKIFVLIILIVSTHSFPGFSKSHLIPEEGLYGAKIFYPYYEEVGNRLLPSHFNRVCQAVVLPSFSEEYAIHIEYDKDKPQKNPIVVSSKFKKQLWSKMNEVLESTEGKKQGHITQSDAQLYAISKIRSKIQRKVAPIDIKLVTLLEKVWVTILKQVRYPQKNFRGFDGTTYHFATLKYGEGFLSGKAWSPSKDTIVYDLVEIVNTLDEYSSVKEENRKHISQNLLKMAESILYRLKNTN